MHRHVIGSLPLFFVLSLASASGQPAEVSGRLWVDVNRDDTLSPGEPGLSGVRLSLLDRFNMPIEDVPPVWTDDQGRYAFSGLPPGEYRVSVDRPAGHRWAGSSVGSRNGHGDRITADSAPDDSDFNIHNDYWVPSSRGPHQTGMRYYELTRLDEKDRPWPINSWAVYPADAGEAFATTRVRELYRNDLDDMTNSMAASRLAWIRNFGGEASDIVLSDPEALADDIGAVIDAPANDDLFPVVVLHAGLLNGLADMIEIADRLASHGYACLCLESTAFQSSVALGNRHVDHGGPYDQSDFDHIPQVGGSDLSLLLQNGYTQIGYITGAWQGSFQEQEAILEADAVHVMDFFTERTEQVGDPLEGRLDFDRVAWVGFSAGAGRSKDLVTGDDRIDVVVNIDSATFLNIPKPSMWLGKRRNRGGGGPLLQMRFSRGFHGAYVRIPSIRFTIDPRPEALHMEIHHGFRDEMLTAFLGYFLKGISGYREDLGLEGRIPTFDGYVGPHDARDFPGYLSEPIHLSAGGTKEIDGGLVPRRLWGLTSGRARIFAIDTSVIDQSSTLSATDVIDYGPLLTRSTAGLVQPTVIESMVVDANGVLYCVSRTSADTQAQLLRLDTRGLVPGLPNVAATAAVLGPPLNSLRGLSIEPRSGRLFGMTDDALYELDPEGVESPRRMGSIDGARCGDIAFDETGTLYETDLAEDLLRILNPADGTILTTFDHGLETFGQRVGLCFDPISKQLVYCDSTTGRIGRFAIGIHDAYEFGSLRDVGISTVRALAFEAPSSVRRGPLLSRLGIHRHRAGLQGIGRLLDGFHLVGSGGHFAGSRLVFRLVEGSGQTTDVLRLLDSGLVRLGNVVPVESADPFLREGREVLYQGEVIGHYETNFGDSISGTRVLPLRIVFNDRATRSSIDEIARAVVLECEDHDSRSLEVSWHGGGGEQSSALRLQRDS